MKILVENFKANKNQSLNYNVGNLFNLAKQSNWKEVFDIIKQDLSLVNARNNVIFNFLLKIF